MHSKRQQDLYENQARVLGYSCVRSQFSERVILQYFFSVIFFPQFFCMLSKTNRGTFYILLII